MEGVAVKERSRNFRGEEIRAILDGRKTQFREVIKEAKTSATAKYFDPKLNNWPIDQGTGEKLNCPYGQVGDRLWVREGCLIDGWYDGNDNQLPLMVCVDGDGETHTVLYRVDYPDLRAIDDDGSQRFRKDGCEASPPWEPSIFMPRWASRLTLEITEIRVERVQEIRAGDIMREGYFPLVDHPEGYHFVATYNHTDMWNWYRLLWDSINGKKYPCSSNPWVWAITFKRIEQPESK